MLWKITLRRKIYTKDRNVVHSQAIPKGLPWIVWSRKNSKGENSDMLLNCFGSGVQSHQGIMDFEKRRQREEEAKGNLLDDLKRLRCQGDPYESNSRLIDGETVNVHWWCEKWWTYNHASDPLHASFYNGTNTRGAATKINWLSVSETT